MLEARMLRDSMPGAPGRAQVAAGRVVAVVEQQGREQQGREQQGREQKVQRNTWQRERVREALAEARGFVSAQSLHATLREENTGIGLATVYRALAGLAEQGDADSLQSPEGESLYRACATPGHHHHLICRSCGLTVEIEATDVEQWARRAAADYGFTQAEHVVDIFGLCAPCARARTDAPVTERAHR